MKKKTTVIFPGIGYHTDKPLLYYSAKLAASYGYEIVRIGYPACDVNLKEATSEQVRAFVDECQSTVREALKDTVFHEGDDILFISKSIGTAIAAAYAGTMEQNVRHVYFTPLEDTFFYTAEKSGIAFNGTRDPWADHGRVGKLCAGGDIPLTTFEGANHSLETGDALKDIDNLRKVMKAVDRFIAGSE